jgi:hypothetical protein
MPLPFVVVVSGNTQMMLFGFSSVSCSSVRSFDVSCGRSDGGEKASRMAWKRVMRSTFRVYGYDRVKMGWKIPAR